jgi:hypothetical protein
VLEVIIKGIDQGTIRIQILIQRQIRPVRLENVLYVPELARSLISIL